MYPTTSDSIYFWEGREEMDQGGIQIRPSLYKRIYSKTSQTLRFVQSGRQLNHLLIISSIIGSIPFYI